MTDEASSLETPDAKTWQYQLRINLADGYAEAARQDAAIAGLEPLRQILRRHGASLKCQFDAFAGYCAEAERHGVEGYPLYAWTKATIENPVKKAKYLKSFTICIGDDEIYGKDQADALEADLQPFVGTEVVASLAKHDTNPANNPQPPRKYRS